MPSALASKLNAWYRRNARDLPWRRTRDPYRIWVSEVMLQQTTVNTVIPYYNRWIKTFPTIQCLASARLPKVLKVWQGLGYYQRARNMHRSARIICRDFNAQIPRDAALLKDLPGFGAYTIGAVLSIAYGQPHPILDTNIRRVVSRHAALDQPQGSKRDQRITDCLRQWMPARNIHIFNQALMELGALICRVREPLCKKCPLKLTCCAFRQRRVDHLGIGQRKSRFENIQVVAGVIQNEDKYFIQQRPEHGLMAGLWEFPGGKIEKRETVLKALQREMKEELAVRVIHAFPLTRIRHAYTRFKVDLHVWHCRVTPWPKTDGRHKWVTLKQLERYPLPAANARILDKLKKYPIHNHPKRKEVFSCVSC